MRQLEIKKEDITGEKISALVSFLDTWEVPEWWTEPRLAMIYWQLKARGEKIDKAEERLEKDRQKKMETYKWKIINEIKQGVTEIRNENWLAWHYEYEIANVKDWEDGRTMQIWFRDIDVDWKTKWRKSILIEEIYNPEFFKEMMDKYAPNLDSKPF